jgi:MFS family permease
MLGMLLWALSTIACMVAQSYAMLFCARLMIGLADASLVPASFSLLSDYFPKAKLAGAVGMATGATFLGTGASLSVGGLVLGVLPMEQTLTLPFGLGIMHGWQWLFGIMSVPGLLLLLAMFLVREPPRRDSGDARVADTKPGPGAILRYFTANAYYLGPLIAGLVLLGAYQYGVTAWAVTLFIRRYGWSATQIGLLYGLYFMIIGSVASIVGGRLADYLRRRGRSDANFLVPLGAVILLTPLAIVFALSANAMLSAVLLGAITFLSVMSFGPAIAAVPAFVDSSLRAQFIALTMMLSTLLGSGGGPWLVAFFTQAVFHDPLALPWSLAICAGLLLLPCGLCFLIGARAARMPRHPA